MKIEIVKTKKGEIEYSTIGKGKPILFVHGGHANCRERLMHKGFDISKYRLITPSRPGYGNTPLIDNVSPKKTADLIIALLDYLKIEKVVLYATSAGGLTSIEIAANYPKRVEKLILASAVTKKWLNNTDQNYKMGKKIFNPKTEWLIWGMIRFFSGIFPRMIANNFYPQFSTYLSHNLDKQDIDELLNTFKYYNSKSGFICDLDHSIEEDVISKIKCPTLIIHSKNDNSVSFEHANHANKSIANSQLEGLNNEWGHLFWIGKDSKESIKKTLDFIEQ